jgi:hypothetical protein
VTDRDLTKTLPGTGPTPLVDGDAVATILRDLVLGVDELGKGLHAKLDKLAPAAPPQAMPWGTACLMGIAGAPAAPPAAPSQPPPASKRQVAGQVAAATTFNLAKWGTFAIGILGIAAQIAKVWRPSLVAPLDQALDLVHQWTGQQ